MRAYLTRKWLSLLALAAAVSASHNAQAVPILQLYVEGATYNSSSETWVASTSNGVFRLWAIGNTDSESLIHDVKLSAVYDSGLAPDISLTAATTGGYLGFTDPSTAAVASYIRTVTDGSSPTLGNGSPLPTHGQYRDGRTWQEFNLGDFSLTDSPLADFQPGSLTPQASKKAHISVYDVVISGLTETATIHFDLYNSVFEVKRGELKITSFKAPFSHDGEGITPNAVPEPGSLTLAALGTLGALIAGRRRRQQAA